MESHEIAAALPTDSRGVSHLALSCSLTNDDRRGTLLRHLPLFT